MIHIISDINIDYQDFAEDQNLISQDCGYIIVTGNIAMDMKRTMIYIEQLASIYPNTKIIFNFGLFDVMGVPYEGIRSLLDAKVNDFSKFNKNIYFPLKNTVLGNYDFLCTFGWPYISDEIEFKQSNLLNNTMISWDAEFYIDGIFISNKFRRDFTLDFVNNQAADEEARIKQWLTTDLGKQKILVTGQGPDSENILKTTKFEMFPNLDLKNVVWITGGSSDYIGPYKNCRLIRLPGRDRSRFLEDSELEFSIE